MPTTKAFDSIIGFVNDESLSFAIRIFVYDSSALFLLTIVLEKANLVSSKVRETAMIVKLMTNA
jgi:hypothetical protein